MKLIVAVSSDWGIGKDNGLLFSIPQDMKFFRETTLNKRVVLGRKNLMRFPNGKPLKNRENIVLTKDTKFECEGALVFHSIDEFLEYDKCDENTFVIGGESIYRQLLPYCDTCFVTKVYESVPCDRFMVNLDESDEWELASETEKIEDNGHIINFLTYKRVK